MKSINWIGIKPAVEVIAIVLAGIFSFFVWGVDALRISAPNWSVSIESFNQYDAINTKGQVSLCDVKRCEEATTCKIEGTVVTENKGKSPINLDNTDIEIYILERNSSNGLSNASAYKYIKTTCIKRENKDCIKPDERFSLAGISKQKLYPAQQGWRPFSIDITPSDISEYEGLDDFAKSHQVLIIAEQKLNASSLNPFHKAESGRVAYMISNLCDRNVVDTTKSTCKSKSECITSQTTRAL